MQFVFCAALMELSRQYRNIIRTDVTEKDGLSVEQIVTYISDHSSTVTLQSTAEHFHYSTAYISRLIAQRTNKTVPGWLTEFKVQKASAVLKSTDLELERIAQMVGYMERRSFEKAFKPVSYTHLTAPPRLLTIKGITYVNKAASFPIRKEATG